MTPLRGRILGLRQECNALGHGIQVRLLDNLLKHTDENLRGETVWLKEMTTPGFAKRLARALNEESEEEK